MLKRRFSALGRTIKNYAQRNRRLVFAVFAVVLICMPCYVISDLTRIKTVPLEVLHYQRILKARGLSSGKCEVPRLDPWDKTILKYYFKPDPLQCKPIQDEVTILKDGILKVLPKYYKNSECRCRTFGHNTGVSDFDLKYDEWKDITSEEGIRITKDFVEVECYNNGMISSKIYSYHWNQITERNASIKTKRPFEASSVDRPSVLLFGVDSMSRSNFIRALPKTHKQLQKMGFVDLQGHVKVGDNTFVNLAAVLTGKRATGTREFKVELTDEWDIYFDDWPFVWNSFSDEGYATMFAEDRPDIGTFNYRGWLRGFKYPPTDHYLRPYWVAAYDSLLFRRSSPGCYSQLPAHLSQLNYLSQFLNKYAGTRSFALHWTQDMSHDFLNIINVVDEDFERFFIENQSKLENTIVIVFSDHGHRYDAIRETIIGRLEARLPFASVLLPKNFVSKYPDTLEALRSNAAKMTTQFDLHETLIDIARGNFSNTQPAEGVQRAYSLLRPTPATRLCFDANIPEDYCPCYNEIELTVNESSTAASHLIQYVNDQLHRTLEKAKDARLKDGFVCSNLDLERIEYASVRVPPVELIKDPQVGGNVASNGLELSYRVIVRMKPPSGALLEGVVVKDLTSNTWKVTGEIERNNRYGNTSHCVSNPVLKKLCHCMSSQI